jgi:hypothetical protein
MNLLLAQIRLSHQGDDDGSPRRQEYVAERCRARVTQRRNRAVRFLLGRRNSCDHRLRSRKSSDQKRGIDLENVPAKEKARNQRRANVTTIPPRKMR